MWVVGGLTGGVGSWRADRCVVVGRLTGGVWQVTIQLANIHRMRTDAYLTFCGDVIPQGKPPHKVTHLMTNCGDELPSLFP